MSFGHHTTLIPPLFVSEDRIRLLRDNQLRPLQYTEQSGESTADSKAYFEKINSISEPAFKTWTVCVQF